MIAAAAAALAAAGPARAQNAVTPAPQSNTTDVGPPQLRDFTLNGTVTRPAPTQAPQPAPAARSPAPRPSTTTALPPASPPASTVTLPEPARRSATVELPPSSPSAALPPAAESGFELPAAASPAPASAPEDPAISEPAGLLPWLLAALLIGAGGAYYLFRVRPRALAAGAGIDEFQAAEPAAAPPPPPPPPPRESRPKPAMPHGGGVVSTALRPWIDVDFIPERTIVSDESIAIEYTLALYNSGSAPARDVLIEAAMFNASPAQDQQIRAFFGNPAGRGDRLETIAPLQRVMVKSAVTVARSEVRPLHADGRPLLVPITALNILYRWGSNNHGQTSASHLVGKETGGDKLAPFRLDLGPRVFRGLAAREHQLKVRD